MSRGLAACAWVVSAFLLSCTLEVQSPEADALWWPDGAAKTDAPDNPKDAKQDSDTSFPSDLVTDNSNPPDGADAVQPDLVTPCGECSGTQPECIEGVCQCNEQSCPAGQFCNEGHCAECVLQTKCGSNCDNCDVIGGFCSTEVGGCAECDSKNLCGEFELCKEGTCSPCEELGYCGPECIQCSGAHPVCKDGACMCNMFSCGDGNYCDGQGCLPCGDSDPQHCGDACVECSQGKPHCVMGTCVGCIQDNDCGTAFVCIENHCVLKPCTGSEGCFGPNNTSPGAVCSMAKVIGRLDAFEQFTYAGNTEGAGDNDAVGDSALWGACPDAGPDQFYKIYLKAGDELTVSADPSDSGVLTKYNLVLKLYKGDACDSTDAAGPILCKNDSPGGQPEGFGYPASEDGWVTIVVDGTSLVAESAASGDYTITVNLACSDDNCCCP